MPVPEILAVDETNDVYLLEDLGDTTLFSYLSEVRTGDEFPEAAYQIYEQVVDLLPALQINAANGLDYSVCYPRARFDKQSMMWDLNYFKYYFLKLAKIPFEEQALEEDFQKFTDYLLQADSEYFLYRDFQSRNIMLQEGKPYFIDYQGGRKGALQYDIASLLYDAKADLPQHIRRKLLNHYLNAVRKHIPINDTAFVQHFYAFVLIRIMQAMGAYGFRGFYEKKEHFLKSIPYALENLNWIISNIKLPVEIPALQHVWAQLVQSDALKKFGTRKSGYHLTVSVCSFSYKKGIPADKSGNGGGFVFDCRALHNPGRYEEYKLLTGKDATVIAFLEKEAGVSDFLEFIERIVLQSVAEYTKRKFTDLQVAFGCTGGQHRSVYCAEELARRLRANPLLNVVVEHTNQPQL